MTIRLPEGITDRTRRQRPAEAAPVTPHESAIASIRASGAWPTARRLYRRGARTPYTLARALSVACPAIRVAILVQIAQQIIATDEQEAAA